MANVAGLTNDTPYYFAVTTINRSNGQRTNVTTVTATPATDVIGPTITNVRIDQTPLTQGYTVSTSPTFKADASDAAGVSRLEFTIDGTLVSADYNQPYSCFREISSVPDGPHSLTITAFDTLGNSASVTYSLNVALTVPGAPTITEPANNTTTNQTKITTSGTADKFTEVIIHNNSVPSAPVPVDAAGRFTTEITLTEGDNLLAAQAQNRTGTGPMSAQVVVKLDTTIPKSPTNVTAQSKENGEIRISWNRPDDTGISGYHIYRAAQPFTTIAQAVKLTSNGPLHTRSYMDIPATEGTYYYRITAMNRVDNESLLSKQASAASDSTMPFASLIEYFPQGNFDETTGRMAPGTVDLVLTVNEPLESKPFLSITPEGATPLAIELLKTEEIEYSGFFVISDTTPTGTAYVVFSGRDQAGNRGTEIVSGSMVEIDTKGPGVTRLEIDPRDPVQNHETAPVTVTVTIGLDEEMEPETLPVLSCLLSGLGRESIEITDITRIDPQETDTETWQAFFEMEPDAGLQEPESFQFAYLGVDDLANESDTILCENLFQVYQGALPPLDPPKNLTAESLAKGKINLFWNMVEEAVGYVLYRQAPDETELPEYETLGLVTEYLDEPTLDGDYIYAVASIRQENAQQSISGLSETITAESDATPPNPPLNLNLELVANGIHATWDAPVYTEPVTYSLYRSDQA
ncbi:MAG: hypothetical protein KAI90_04645, partial [Desulfobulbaceae bacterium]|nr:hypothetical protein [Desulfobulbaceae bacterium]